MDEFQIAKYMADVLDKLQHPGNDESCPPDQRMSRFSSAKPKLGKEELELGRLDGMAAELALSRARATDRDFNTVMIETQLRVSMELARILATTIDPVLEGLKETVVLVEEDGHVCGVCQEEMCAGEEARAMDCKHKFHPFCIFKWLKHKNACPLCRFRMCN